MKKLALLLAVMFLFIASPAFAFKSSALLDRCSEAEKSFQKLDGVDNAKSFFCIAYLWGLIDTYDALKREDKEPLYCLPERDMKMYVSTVTQFLKENPDHLSYEAPVSIIQSFIEAFPCSIPMSTE